MSDLPTKNSTIRDPRVVIIGGGGGTAAIYPKIAAWTTNAVAILGVSDSGGSTGRLSAELKLRLPVGDIRNVMMAASNSPAVRKLRQQRFAGNGTLRGHAVGNMVLAACLSEPGVDIDEALELASDFFQVPGTVLPAARTAAELCMEDGPGNVIRGEHAIDVYHTKTREPRVWLEPDVAINPRAEEALRSADIIVIPAGSIYTSILATLSIKGVADILQTSRVPVVMLANLATEKNQTDNWHVSDFVLALQRHGIKIDVVLYNNAAPTAEMLANYAAAGQKPVDASPALFAHIPGIRVLGSPLLSQEPYSQNPNDPVKRGLMRHDANKVVRQLKKILAERADAA